MYDRSLFNKRQLRELKLCEEQGLDTNWADPDLNWRQMREIRRGLENGIDAQAYAAYPSLTWQEMEQIRNDMEYGFSFDPAMYGLENTGEVVANNETGKSTPEPPKDEKDEFLGYFEAEAQDNIDKTRNTISSWYNGEHTLSIMETEVMNHLDSLGINGPLSVSALGSGFSVLCGETPVVEVLLRKSSVQINLNGTDFTKEKTLLLQDGEIVKEENYLKQELENFTNEVNNNGAEKLSLFAAMKEAREIEAEALQLKKEVREITLQAYANGIMPESSKTLVNEKTALLVEKQKEIAAKIRQIGFKETVKDSFDKTKTFFRNSFRKFDEKTNIVSKTAVRLAVVSELCRMREIQKGIKNLVEITKEEVREIREEHKYNKDKKQFENDIRWANYDQKIVDVNRDTLTKDYLIAKAAKEHFEALEEKRVEKEEKYAAFREAVGDIKTAFGNIGRVITGKELEEFNYNRDNNEKPVSDFVKMSNYYQMQMDEIEAEFNMSKQVSMEEIENTKTGLGEKYSHIQGAYSSRTEDYLDTTKGFQSVIDSINNRKVDQFSEYGRGGDVKNSEIKKEIRNAKREIKENKKKETEDRER